MSVTSPTSLFQYAIASLGQAFSPAVSIQNTSDFIAIFTDATTLVDTELVLNVDYTVTGTFTAGVCPAPTVTLEGVGLHYAVGGTLTIQRHSPLTQPTVYVDGVKYLASTTNNALDWIVYGLQELRDMVKRSLRIPITNAEQNELLKATRRLQVVGFDSDGNVTTYPLSAVVFASGQGIQVSSISAMKAVPYASVSDKFQIMLSGYYQPGDGGGGPFYVDKTDTMTADNGGTVFVAADSTRLKRVFSGAINVKWFGAKGDGTTDDSTAVANWRAAILGKSGFIPVGVYPYSAGLIINTSCTKIYGEAVGGEEAILAGDSTKGSVLKYTGTGIAISVNDGAAVGAFKSRIEILDIGILTGSTVTCGLKVTEVSGCKFSGISIFGMSQTGIGLNVIAGTNNRFTNIDIAGYGVETLPANYLAKGLQVDFLSGSPPTTTVFDTCYFHYCVLGANSGPFITFRNCIFETCTTGVQVLYKTNLFENCWFENNTSNYYIGGGLGDAVFNNCEINSYALQYFGQYSASPVRVVFNDCNFLSTHATPVLNLGGSIAGSFIAYNRCKFPINISHGGSSYTGAPLQRFEHMQIRMLSYSVAIVAGVGNSSNAFVMPDTGFAMQISAYYSSTITAGNFNLSLIKNGVNMTSLSFPAVPVGTGNVVQNTLPFAEKFVAGDKLVLYVQGSADILPVGGTMTVEVVIYVGDILNIN